MGAPVEMIGKRFGRLLVVERGPDHIGKSRTRRWVCRCDCGASVTTYGNGLRSGHVKSCGCLQAEVVASASTTHGGSTAPEYRVWVAMRARCQNPSHEAYANYGGRGIRVCDRWDTSFAAFLEDMGPRPTPGHSIERRDNDKPYEATNCYWATRAEQDRNKRNTVLITFEGETLTLSEWGRRFNASPATLRQRWRKFSTLRPVGRHPKKDTE